MTTISDLSWDLVREIFSRVPLSSLSAVRSACKTWKAISKNLILGQKSANKQFMAFMTIEHHYNVYSFRFDLQGIRNENYSYDDEDLGKHISMPTHQVKISQIFHCDGLLLYVPLDLSRLFVCNPYLEQSRLVQTRNKFHRKSDMYVLGYDNNNNHKILSFSVVDVNIRDIEVYCFSSDTWRVLDIGPMHCNLYSKCFVSLKGNAYLYSPNHASMEQYGLVCFDFTTERYGPLLPLPQRSHGGYPNVTDIISSNEKLVLLDKGSYVLDLYACVEIWITTKIEPNVVLWNKFFKLNCFCPKGLFPDNYWCNFDCRSWLIDEEKKVVVFFDIAPKNDFFQMAYIIGEDGGYFRSVFLGEAPYPEWVYDKIEYYTYVPSLVQLKV